MKQTITTTLTITKDTVASNEGSDYIKRRILNIQDDLKDEHSFQLEYLKHRLNDGWLDSSESDQYVYTIYYEFE